MFDKINITEICQKHINTLCDAKTGKISKSDLFLFFGVPLIISFLLTFLLSPVINADLQAIFATVFSIFTALLLSLLVLLYTMSSSKEESNDIDKDKKNIFHEVLNETLSSISFLILVSIFSLATIILLAIINYATYTPLLEFIDSIIQYSNYLALLESIKYTVQVFPSFISYCLVGIFLVTILMVLKRVMLLLDTLLDETNEGSK